MGRSCLGLNEYSELVKNCPCDDCNDFNLCANKEMACESYYKYIVGEKNNNFLKYPKKSIYNKIFNKEK